MLQSIYMWRWVAGFVVICILIAAQLKLDFIHAAHTALEGHVSNVRQSLHMNTQSASTFSLSSSAFAQNGAIPSAYTCDLPASPGQAGGTTTNPPLQIAGVPQEAKSLALIMDDPDVPKQVKPDGMFDHWVLFNIPANTTEIGEGKAPGVQGANGAGKAAYTGPCPPKQYEPSEHRYFFKLYALDTVLDLEAGATKAQVEQAMEGHILAQTQLIGRYKRP